MQAQNESLANFSSNLARLLKERGCQKKDFAAKMQVSPTVISNWLRGEENGGYYPRKKTLLLIADFFGITVADLLGEHEEHDIMYWQALCKKQQAEIEALKAQLAGQVNTSDSDKLKEALKLIVDAVADLVEERSRKK